ncbi:MAG: SH3 domain-containing protein [Acutalibacteraceae bacterium]
MKRTLAFILCLFSLISVFGFVPKTAAANSSSYAGKVVTSSGNLNVRKSASTSSDIIKTLKNGSWITLMSKSGDFWKVEYANGKYGYCHSSYISKKSGTVMYVALNSSSLNVRSGAGTSYAVKDSLSNGTCVIVISKGTSWHKILYSGTKTGYVSAKYLSEKKPSYSAVNLNVVSFKQTDSRWKNVKIGTQGDTIGSSGCTTTCLAMTESFAQNKTVTPAAMASKLSYSASGSLYWPSNYNTQLVSSSDYLSFAYSMLKQGKPVIIGAKKANGSQHWVVVTGFSGGSSLKAASFSINDPGSNTRTTLADFTNEYPVLYKAAWRAS